MDHSQHFESIGTVTTMLIENLNMQMEAESSDLLDRRLISLYGYNNPNAKEDLSKAEAIGASAILRGQQQDNKKTESKAQPTRHKITPSLLENLKDGPSGVNIATNTADQDTTDMSELNFPKINTASFMNDTQMTSFNLRQHESSTAETVHRQKISR